MMRRQPAITSCPDPRNPAAIRKTKNLATTTHIRGTQVTEEQRQQNTTMETKTEDTTNSPKTIVTNNANTTELEATIKKNYAGSALNGCKKQKLPTMKGRPRELFVDPKARPFAIHKQRPIVVYWEKEARTGLDRDTNTGAITPKEVGEPTTWYAPMYVVAIKSGKPRRVADFQKMNQACVGQAKG